MKTADEVVKSIHSAIGDGDKQGLRNTAALLEALQAEPVCPVIHVAGTNGKGSVCAMLNTILKQAGYRTGMYTSPFLQIYYERIRLDGRPVSNEQLEEYGNETLYAAEKLKVEKNYHATPFELGTAMAFHTFRKEKAEIIISETGMGGRLDPTNAIRKPAICAITTIGMDHMQYLGNTLAEIAKEKAGIIKKDVPVIVSSQDNEVIRQVMISTAREKRAPLTLLYDGQIRIREINARYSTADFETEGKTWENVKISLPGAHQLKNALTVISITEELNRQGIAIPEDAVIHGIGNTFWPGRLEWCGNILMDGAHNAQGVKAFGSFTEEQLCGERKVLLTGVLREKLSDEMLDGLSKTAAEAVTITPDSPRAMPAGELAELLQEKGMKAHAAKSLHEGLTEAKRSAGESGIVLATGSLYFIGALRNELGLKA